MEILDLYDNKKRKLDKTIIRENNEPENGEFKLSVHVWIMNSNREFLIQKRSLTIKSNPNKWAFTGGAVSTNETSYNGAIREVKEELGLELDFDKVEFLLGFKREKDFVDVWLARVDVPIENIRLQKEEVSEAKWVTFKELDEMIKNNEFVSSINLYYDLFKKLLEKCHDLEIIG